LSYLIAPDCNQREAMPARRSLLLLLPLLFSAWANVALAQLAQYTTAPLTIVTAGGPRKFTVELATTPAQMEQGLMFRRSLAPDAGMLFDYQTPSMATMWMKNTLIPLDMLFVDAQGHIVNIHERAVPGSLATISAAAPVRAVIELNGGTASRLGIRPGDRVIYPIFGNASNLADRASPCDKRRFVIAERHRRRYRWLTRRLAQERFQWQPRHDPTGPDISNSRW
jgi:uncharacterized membrane protein (UPF0127 family)